MSKKLESFISYRLENNSTLYANKNFFIVSNGGEKKMMSCGVIIDSEKLDINSSMYWGPDEDIHIYRTERGYAFDNVFLSNDYYYKILSFLRKERRNEILKYLS